MRKPRGPKPKLIRLTARQRKILDLILRLSWGCAKKDAYIPHQRDFNVVGVHEVDVKDELTWLEVSKVIARQEAFYWFNKNYDEWDGLDHLWLTW